MIEISIIRDKQGYIREFTVLGHAGAGESGNDIVCAAVSAIAYTALNALEEIAGIKNCYTIKDGYIKCSLPINISDDKKKTAKIIMDTIAVGFKQIEYTDEYKSYVSVLEEEV